MGAFKDIFDIIIVLIRSKDEDKKSFFENHAEPLNKKIRQIHKDYVSGFKEVRDKLDKRSVPSGDLIAFLRDRRREIEDERQHTKNLAYELSKPEHTLFSGDLRIAIHDYCKAILEYFAASGTIAGYTWFTGFIDTVEHKTKLGAQDVWWSMSISGNPRGDLLEEVKLMLDERLPKAFENVSSTYARLKVLCI